MKFAVKQVLNIRQKQNLIGRIQLANLLKLNEREFCGCIKEIEETPLFKRLFYPQNPQEKIIRRKKFRNAGLSQGFYELKEDLVQHSSTSDIDSLLLKREKNIPLIKKVGQENFEKYFLYNENINSIEDIAEACNITLQQVRELNEFINEFSLASEHYNPSEYEVEEEMRFTKIAAVKRSGESFSIQFFSPHMVMGEYIIDYQKYEVLKSKNFFSAEELAEIEGLINKLKQINTRKTVLYQIIEMIIKNQRTYFISGNWLDLQPLTQKRISNEIKVHPSTVSRLSAGRSIEMPWGEERPLKDFFLGKTKKLKGVLKFIIDKNDKISTDKEIKNLLKEKYGIEVSVRLINKCRNDLKITLNKNSGINEKKKGSVIGGYKYEQKRRIY